MPNFPLVAYSVKALSRSTDFAYHLLGFSFDKAILSAAAFILNFVLVLIFAVQFGSGFVHSSLPILDLGLGFG